jgi:hypothetical protein
MATFSGMRKASPGNCVHPIIGYLNGATSVCVGIVSIQEDELTPGSARLWHALSIPDDTVCYKAARPRSKTAPVNIS